MRWANLIPWSGKHNGPETGENAWLSPINQFHSEVDRLFDRFFSDEWNALPATREWEGWAPAMDVSESEKEITLRAELPGVDAKDLDISVTGDILTISGHKEEKTEKQEKGFFHSECHYGSFRRAVTLPATVNAEEVAAEFKNGILTIRLAKVENPNAKRIPVATS